MGLGVYVHVHVHGWGVASKSAGVTGRDFEVEGVAGAAACLLLVAIPHSSSPLSWGAGTTCMLEVEEVSGVAACLLLTLGVLFSFSLSRGTGTACVCCLVV